MSAWLDPLRSALDSTSLDRVDFFFRDDDAGWDDRRLWLLLDRFAECALPVDLAVIPNALTPAAAEELLRRSRGGAAARIGFHQHGWAHVNHEVSGRKYEFGPSRPEAVQRNDIARGRACLIDLLGPDVDPIFTPPWNRCTAATGRSLARLGFGILSREARAERLAIRGLRELPVTVDWFAHRKHVRLPRPEFGALLARALEEPGPIGLMFHHAAMDREERAAAAHLLALLAEHPRVRTAPMISVAEPASSQRAAP